MRITIKFTAGNARNTFYFLNCKYKTNLKFNERNFEKLAKLAIMTESSNEAKLHIEKLEKLLPLIMEEMPEDE